MNMLNGILWLIDILMTEPDTPEMYGDGDEVYLHEAYNRAVQLYDKGGFEHENFEYKTHTNHRY